MKCEWVEFILYLYMLRTGLKLCIIGSIVMVMSLMNYRSPIFCFSSHSTRMMSGKSYAIPSGLCAVYKPKGRSSNDIVQQVKSIIQRKFELPRKKSGVKVGHGGTLDPMAEGVLVLGLGSGTKLLTNFLSGSKGYRAVATLGIATDTLDITGTVLECRDCSNITHADLEKVLPSFRGDIEQMPPMYSALNLNGKRLYDLARKGIEVERKARAITIFRLDLLADRPPPEFVLDVECGGGTYIRSLIDDISKQAGGIGCMTELVRTKQSIFTLQDCIKECDWTYENIMEHTDKCNKLAEVPLEFTSKKLPVR